MPKQSIVFAEAKTWNYYHIEVTQVNYYIASLLLMAVGRGGISTSVGDSTQVLSIFHG